MSHRPSGRIITFYSYKGGTGRSMALANVAWILASRRQRVLMIDWDLEAPGLHRYFHPFLEDKGLTTSEGIIDFFMRFEEAASAPASGRNPGDGGEAGQQWYLPLADPGKYIVPLAWPLEFGTLDLLPAGKQGPSYAARVNSFNWAGFYERLGGGVFIEAMKQKLREQYDYILVDSRTGVSDTAGVCTVQMPDDVVVCFTYNVQSIEGAAAVASAIRSQRESDVKRDPPAFRIFPVPMRIERAEMERLNHSRDFARNAFAGFIDHIKEARRNEYWGEIEVPYVPFYAYQEVLATVGDHPGLRDSLLRSCERIVDFVTGADTGGQQILPDLRREQIKQMFLRRAETGGVRMALKRHPELQDFSDEIVTLQKAWDESKQERCLLDRAAIDRLRGNAELHIGLLEDRNFRAFFETSERRLTVNARIRSFRWASGVIAASLVLLIATVLYRRTGVGFTPIPLDYLEYAFAGVLGAAYVQVFNGFRTGADDVAMQRPVVVPLTVVTGAMSGLLVLTLIQSSLFGLSLERSASAESFWQYVLPLAIPFFAGFASSTFVPTVIDRVEVVQREARR